MALAFVVPRLLADVSASNQAAGSVQTSAAFDSAKGFQPAQSDLVAVYLQIAGSLEAYGSPEPYLRHMQAEHARIEAKYRQQTGEKPCSFCPAYMDASYLDRFAANWQHLAPQLQLEALARSTGHSILLAIKGPDGKETILADVLHRHQQEVRAALASRQDTPTPGFDGLRTTLVGCLWLDATPAEINALSMPQQAVAAPAHDIQAAFQKRFAAVDAGLSAADATKVKAALLAIVTDVGRMAESELQAASLEQALDKLHAPKSPYHIGQEVALNAEEQKTLAELLKKPRFTKADFPTLDRFYQGPYDRLSERGKDELSARIDAGMMPAVRAKSK